MFVLRYFCFVAFRFIYLSSAPKLCLCLPCCGMGTVCWAACLFLICCPFLNLGPFQFLPACFNEDIISCFLRPCSLGGLISRFAVGKLAAVGFLASSPQGAHGLSDTLPSQASCAAAAPPTNGCTSESEPHGNNGKGRDGGSMSEGKWEGEAVQPVNFGERAVVDE